MPSNGATSVEIKIGVESDDPGLQREAFSDAIDFVMTMEPPPALTIFGTTRR
jgi:hypothetical protein